MQQHQQVTFGGRWGESLRQNSHMPTFQEDGFLFEELLEDSPPFEGILHSKGTLIQVSFKVKE